MPDELEFKHLMHNAPVVRHILKILQQMILKMSLTIFWHNALNKLLNLILRMPLRSF